MSYTEMFYRYRFRERKYPAEAPGHAASFVQAERSVNKSMQPVGSASCTFAYKGVCLAPNM